MAIIWFQPFCQVLTISVDFFEFDDQDKIDLKKKVGKLRFEIQVIGLNDAPFGKANFQYPMYTINFQVIKCENIPSSKIIEDEVNLYCMLAFNENKTKQRTETISNDLNPFFNNKFQWFIEHKEEQKVIHVFLINHTEFDEKIVSIDLNMNDIEYGKIVERKVSIGCGDLIYR